MREAGEEVVLDAAGFLNARVQPRILQRDRRPGRDAHREPFVVLGETSDIRMAEEQAADDVARSSLHRYGEIAAHGHVTARHAVVRGVVAVPRVLRDVRTANHAGSLERRSEHLRIPRHRKLGEGLARHARDRVQRVRLATLVEDVVEERAEFGRGELGGGIRHSLHDLVAVQVGRDDRSDVVQGLRDLGVFAQEAQALRLRLLEGRDVPGDLGCADDRAGVVAHRRNGQRDIDTPAILGDPHRLEVFDSLALSQPGQDVVFFGLPFRRNQHANRLSHEFVGRIAKQPLGGCIARLDDAVQVFGDDRVLGRVDDRRQIRLRRERLYCSEMSRK